MNKVAIYHKSVPNLKNQQKIDLLKFFSNGVVLSGDAAINVPDYSLVDSDVGVIQGWISSDIKRPHLALRNTVIRNQLAINKYVIAADSNLFLYSNTNNPFNYIRYSFNGITPNTGIYCDTAVDSNRWKSISTKMNINLLDYRVSGSHILLCLQRNGGWSMNNVDIIDWALSTIREIRKHSDRLIIIRGHPGDKTSTAYLNPHNPNNKLAKLQNVKISQPGNSLQMDLIGCWAVINCNSSPVVGAAILGYPIFVTDPSNSQCADIANTSIADIENPRLPDRQQWVERISMSHWNFDELNSGQCWSHMRSYMR